MSFGFIYRIRQETVPRHLRHRHRVGHERHGRVEHVCVIGGVRIVGLVDLLVSVGQLGGCFMLKVGYQHCSVLKIKIALTACLYLLQRRRVHVQTDGRLGGRRRLRGGFCARPPLDFADERSTAIFCVHGAIVSQEQVSSDEGAPALLTLERSLFGVCE